MAFVASLVHSLAWPAGIVVVVIVLRRPIGVVLGRGVRRLRAGPVEVEFELTVTKDTQTFQVPGTDIRWHLPE